MTERNTSIVQICCLALIVITSFITHSFSSFVLLLIIFLFGNIITWFVANDRNERGDIAHVFNVAMLVTTILAFFQWLGYDSDYANFASGENDNYKFFIASMDGVYAKSLYAIFKNCIIDNAYYENGGYYFYIQSIAYIGNLIDENHLYLQQIGTALPCILSSIVVYKTLSHFCIRENVVKYTISFILFSPLIIHSCGVHRDSMIALLYFICMYIWLCKSFSLKTFLLQSFIALILFYFREQHGLFAISFIALSAITSESKSRWLNIVALAILVLSFGSTFLLGTLQNNYLETTDFYDSFGSDALAGVNSGFGRFVYALPSPIKEIAQVFFSQLMFPPWDYISRSSNIYFAIVGFQALLISVVWFYYFVSVMLYVFRNGFSAYPRKIVYGLGLFFLFLVLNTSNLETRRIVCVYPLLFLAFVYARDYLIPISRQTSFKRDYALLYACLCLFYMLLKLRVG